MSTTSISLPNTPKDFVTSSEHVLIRKDEDRRQLRGLLLAGVQSAPTAPVDVDYFDALRKRIGNHSSH
nr:type II toxin-antitoxin system ParD family antitoxin [uncultured Albidiferax sp.]